MSRDGSSDETEGSWIFVLCAEWCGVCRELKRSIPSSIGQRVSWIDIEADAHLVEGLDIENFPTLAVFRGEDGWVFYGAVEPYWGAINGMRRFAGMELDDALRLALTRMKGASS